MPINLDDLLMNLIMEDIFSHGVNELTLRNAHMYAGEEHDFINILRGAPDGVDFYELRLEARADLVNELVEGPGGIAGA